MQGTSARTFLFSPLRIKTQQIGCVVAKKEREDASTRPRTMLGHPHRKKPPQLLTFSCREGKNAHHPSIFRKGDFPRSLLGTPVRRGHIAFGISQKAPVVAMKFLKNHRTTPSRARPTSMTPSSMTARKNIGAMPLSKSMSYSMKPRSRSPAPS